MTNKPIIGFNEYSDEWEEITLSDIAEIVDRKTDEQSNAPVMMISSAYGFINQSEKYSTDNAGSSLKNYILLKKGELAYNHGYSALRNFGSCFTLEKEEARIPFVYHCFSIPSQNPYFYGYYLNCGIFDKQLRKLVASTARMDGLLNISYSDYTSIKVKKPSENEQKELATFFKNINNLIISTQEKLDKAIILKKSMLEKMFPKNGAKVPELRFTGFSGNWQVSELSNYLEVVTEKNESELYSKENVLSVSGDYGVVNQIEHQGKSLAGASLINYGVVHTGDVVYTKSPLKEQPYGIIKTNKGKTGIVSALYGIFRKKSEIITDFIQYYFESDRRLNEYLRPLVNKGAKNTLLVSDEDSIKGIVYIPSIMEQEVIIKYFDESSKLITNYRNELEKLKTIKKSLLEKMFV